MATRSRKSKPKTEQEDIARIACLKNEDTEDLEKVFINNEIGMKINIQPKVPYIA